MSQKRDNSKDKTNKSVQRSVIPHLTATSNEVIAGLYGFNSK